MPRRKQDCPKRVSEEDELAPVEPPKKPKLDDDDVPAVVAAAASPSPPAHSPSPPSPAAAETFVSPLDLSVKKPSTRGPADTKHARPPVNPSPPPKVLSPPHVHAALRSAAVAAAAASTSPLASLAKVNGADKLKPFGSKLSTGGLSSRSGSHGRQNPWQTQWINRSSEQTRDVFTCVWCKESFRSLQEMTVHMKESPRCGMAGMQQAAASVSSLPAASTSPSAASSSPAARNGNERSAGGKEPMSSAVLAKNNVNMPRKLVRGQDVWLGRGAEQTRQILKCK